MHQSHSIVALIAAGAPAAPSDRTSKFAVQLTERLAGLPHDTARRKELERLELMWIARYERFAADVDSGAYDPPPDGPTAFDYVMTIGEINAQLGRLRVAA